MIEFPTVNDSILVLIDVQEKFVPAIDSLSSILPRQQIMLEAAKELNLKTIVTEQYTKGLGVTIDELISLIDKTKTPVLEKTAFSCFGSCEFRKTLKQQNVKNIILIGIETHVCVLQTAFDALNDNYNVFVLSDAVTSRKIYEKEKALRFMREEGIKITTVESLLFMLMKDAKHPSFRSISKKIK